MVAPTISNHTREFSLILIIAAGETKSQVYAALQLPPEVALDGQNPQHIHLAYLDDTAGANLKIVGAGVSQLKRLREQVSVGHGDQISVPAFQPGDSGPI